MSDFDHYLRICMNLCSREDVQTRHSGSDPELELEYSDDDSIFTNPPFEFLQTYDESVDPAADMSQSPQEDGKDPREIVRQNPANISEWVDQQSLAMPVPKVVISTPTLDNKSEKSEKSETRQKISGGLAGEKLQQKVYGIPALLSLGEGMPTKDMELRIHPGALTENIFKDRTQKANPKSQEKMRFRGLSDHLTLNHRTNRSEEEIIYSGRDWVNAQKPYREAQDPPAPESAQQQEGFKRFLKEVASPPHNRVTAGGRIVPAGPSFPPPMLNYGSIETTINQPVSKPLSGANAATKSNARVGGTDAQISSHMLQGQYKVNQNTAPSGLHQLEAAQVQVSGNINRGDFDGNLSMGPTMQFPQGIEPLQWVAGAGAIVSLNGVQYRASWNGPQLVLEPLQAFLQATPFFTASPEHAAMMYAQLAHGSHYPVAVKPVTATETQLSPNTTSQYASCQLQPTDQSSRKASNEEYDNWRAKLTELDRHLALYYNKLSGLEHSVLVSHRRELVEKIDSIRKDRNERTVSFSAPVVGQQTDIGPQPQHSTGNSMKKYPEAVPAPLVIKKLLAPSTYLSPDAPPFVPSNTKPGSNNAGLGNSWGAPNQSNHSFGNSISQNNGRVQNYGPRIEVPSATQAKHDTGPKAPGVDSTTSQLGEAGRGPVREPLPVVSQDDIEYAARLGLNPAHGVKLYCTTVPEFQEVIRRVREQATLYGCEGGQSKDPAFDAEQDVRWAIADHDPIRLPRSPPDHVVKPRAWNWCDSIFNVCTRNRSAVASLVERSSSTYIPSSRNSQERSSGANILDDPFSNLTRRGAEVWKSDRGIRSTPIYAGDREVVKGLGIAKDVNPPSTPKSVTKLDVSSGSAIHTPAKSTKGRSPQIPLRGQSYGEDSCDTPTSGRAQVIAKGIPVSGDKDRSAEKGKKALNPDFKHEDDGGEELAPSNYWPNAGVPSVRADEGVRLGYQREVRGTNDVTGSTSPTQHRGSNMYDSWAPITDSKSRWGPEEDTVAWGLRKPGSYDGWAGVGAPKVNIPFAPPRSFSQPAPPEPRKGSTAPSVKYSNSFLRGILKSPHYAYPPIRQTVPSAAEMRLRANHGAELERFAPNKENLKAEAQCKLEWVTAHGPSPSTPTAIGQDARKNKARSSLASSNFQVHGVLDRSGRQDRQGRQGRQGRQDVNRGHLDSSSQSGGVVPQHLSLGHQSQLPVTPLHNGPPDFYFATELRQDNHGRSSSGIPRYDRTCNDMTDLSYFKSF